MRERPAMDPVLQAFSGLMSVNMGEDGIPHRVGVVICDMATALYGFQALSTALYTSRRRKGLLDRDQLDARRRLSQRHPDDDGKSRAEGLCCRSCAGRCFRSG